MAKVLTVHYSDFYDYRTKAQFVKTLDQRTRCYVGIADVLDGKSIDYYHQHPKFKVLTDDDYLEIVTPFRRPPKRHAVTGDPLTDEKGPREPERQMVVTDDPQPHRRSVDLADRGRKARRHRRNRRGASKMASTPKGGPTGLPAASVGSRKPSVSVTPSAPSRSSSVKTSPTVNRGSTRAPPPANAGRRPPAQGAMTVGPSNAPKGGPSATPEHLTARDMLGHAQTASNSPHGREHAAIPARKAAPMKAAQQQHMVDKPNIGSGSVMNNQLGDSDLTPNDIERTAYGSTDAYR